MRGKYLWKPCNIHLPCSVHFVCNAAVCGKLQYKNQFIDMDLEHLEIHWNVPIGRYKAMLPLYYWKHSISSDILFWHCFSTALVALCRPEKSTFYTSSCSGGISQFENVRIVHICSVSSSACSQVENTFACVAFSTQSFRSPCERHKSVFYNWHVKHEQQVPPRGTLVSRGEKERKGAI